MVSVWRSLRERLWPHRGPLHSRNGGLNTRSYLYWGYLRLVRSGWRPGGCPRLIVTVRQPVPRVVLALVALGVITPYLFYRPYDHWETLRFLLPVIVVATIVAASGIASKSLVVWRVMAAGPAMVASSLQSRSPGRGCRGSAVNQVFTMPAQEARHRLAGELVAQVTPQTRCARVAAQRQPSLLCRNVRP